MANKKVMNVHPFEFDSRLVEWNLKHGLITKDQLKTFVSSLPDDAAGAQTLELDESNGVDESSN